MKSCLLLLSFFLFVTCRAFAQQEKKGNSTEPTTQNAQANQQTLGLLSGFGNRTTPIHESYYLDPNWSIAKVRFYERTIGTSKGPVKLDSISDVQIRVALQGNDVEFKTEEGIKVLSGSLVRSFSIKNGDLPKRNFINTLEFNDITEQIKKGFFEVIADGEIKLLEYCKLRIEHSNYSTSFNIGSKDEKVNLDKLLFSTRDKEIQRFTGKKDLFELMVDKKTQIEKFVKDNNLNLKNKEHLVKIFHYYNSIKKES